jgi:L-lactate utilization protein LutB
VKGYKESKVIAEVRKIRKQIQHESRKIGFDKYWAEANKRAAEFLGKVPVVKESPGKKYGQR